MTSGYFNFHGKMATFQMGYMLKINFLKWFLEVFFLFQGGIGACLQYIDFFSLASQRSALQIVANCCLHMTSDDFQFLVDSLPALTQRLTSTVRYFFFVFVPVKRANKVAIFSGLGEQIM